MLSAALFVAVLGSMAFASGGASADSVGTLQVGSPLFGNFTFVDCPAGTPTTTACHPNVSAKATLVPGLGTVTTAPFTLVLDDFGTACTRVHTQVPILVAGKGEIDLAMPLSGCIGPNQLGGQWPAIPVTVSGGSGRYAGASGSGAITIVTRVRAPETGSATWTWTGTLNVPGLTFDTTPPQITGAASKRVKTRSAKGTRVRYSVSATDATDGTVPVDCRPKSGSVFRVRRTTVGCTSTDSSGNRATKRFVITVRRSR
jgi:hypothetical protein